METKFYTKGEEITNAITHGVGGLLAIAGFVVLIVLSAKYGNAWYVVANCIFGTCMILLYVFSTLYHSLTNRKAKKVFRVFDHSSIYILIAGTYTAYTLTVLRDPLGWTIFGIEWGLAVIGIVFKAIIITKDETHLTGKIDKISTLIYVFMGWFIVIDFRKLILMPNISQILLLVGGVIYTLGAVLYSKDKIPYNHPVWHLMVMGGSICHYFSVLYLLPIK